MSQRILSFALFEAKTGLTREQEAFLNKCTEGTWTYNPSTGLVDVDGNFYCSEQNLKDFQGVKFGKVGGYFNCSYNSLTSLAGAPQKVGGDFKCKSNKLTSLAGAPQKVGGDFDCFRNSLTSLAGAPQKVGISIVRTTNSQALQEHHKRLVEISIVRATASQALQEHHRRLVEISNVMHLNSRRENGTWRVGLRF